MTGAREPPSADGWRFWIDRGGTFTDVVARAPDGALHVEKLLSEASGYADAAVEAVRRVLARHGGGRVEAVHMGTTVATNALLERRGEPTVFVTTRGHADALAIGWQSRPRLFDLDIQKPAPLHGWTVEAQERVTAEGEVLAPLDEARLEADLRAAHAQGARAAAIVFLHGWRHPAHERRAVEIARAAGFAQVTASAEAGPLVRLVSRGNTAVADAYLSPVLGRYVGQVRDALAATPGAEDARLLFMQSSGGLAAAEAFRGKDAVLSGPAGGLVAMAATATAAGFDRVIGFDMGGTSTDVSRYAGRFEHAEETEVAGVRLRAPMLAVHTVAAGGGSVCRFEGGRLRVGPQSAGADPGPACYRRGGPLTVTDCNVLLGRLRPQHFPAVFGPGGDQPIDGEAVRAGFAALADAVEAATGARRSPEDLAEGFLQVAVETMARAIRRVSTERGHDLADHVLASFGGAGGQHAARVAQALGMSTVMLHPLAGVLSAYGVGLAPLQATRARTLGLPLDAEAWPRVEAAAAELAGEARAAVAAQGGDAVEVEVRLGVRYAGVDAALPVPLGPREAVAAAFAREHRARFGFATPGRALVVETATAEATAGGHAPEAAAAAIPPPLAPAPSETVAAWFAGAPRPTPVHARSALAPGAAFDGPAIVREATGTVVVEPGWRARVDAGGVLLLERTDPPPLGEVVPEGPEGAAQAAARFAAPSVGSADSSPSGGASASPDPLQLELYASRFMAAAEEMGAALQATAASVNIKERLDFSCALFDRGGALVANAPHIPVHLGSMGESVKAVMRARAEDGRGLVPGDAYMHNAPYSGGTHLPDITVIAPVFDGAAGDLLAWVAARGHHADVGGLTPGSMPPHSRTLADEGALFDDGLLVEGDGAGGGTLREADVRARLAAGPLPARNPDENMADLRAQLAACAKGAAAVRALHAAHGRGPVDAYMAHLQDAAARAVRARLADLTDGAFRYEMDDGAVIAVALRVDRAARRLAVDFTGTSAQRPTNFNAPLSITRAAVLYVLRTLVALDIPLNDGCLRPVDLIVPRGCMLDPVAPGAVVAGNVETSQAVVDALYGALLASGHGVVAASQGTMNNLTFGDGARQYYETICGGAGAGPGFRGADAVQTHMTNSRLTDPEVLETRFPVRVDRFAIRRGSGGAGAWRGGDGVERRLVFREPMTASILSGHRRTAPFGAEGGAPGALGANRVERADGTVEPLAGVDRSELGPGDALVIETPGGGGWGAPEAA